MIKYFKKKEEFSKTLSYNNNMKAIKVKIYPIKKQQELINKHFGCNRFVYNFALEKSIKYYQENKKHLNKFEIMKFLPKLKKEKEWLKEVHSQSLQQTIRDLDSAFSHFFKRNNEFPIFKSKKNPKQAYRLPQGFEINREKKSIKIPKLKWIKFRDKFNVPNNAQFRNITILKDGNEYFVSICYKTNEKLKEKKVPTINKTLGIDLGVRTLATLSNGTKVDNPKHFKKYQDKLKAEQQKLSNKNNKETKAFRKQKEKVQKVHKKIRNTRKDFLHKLTTNIVENKNYSSIAIEDLAVKESMQENFSPMAKLIGDAGWRMFRQMLEYKCEDKAKNLLVIGRFDASSKTCNVCGSVYHELKREEKEWICKKCKAKHDRDINAAINIKKFGYRKYEVGQTSGEALAKPRTSGALA